MVVEDLCFKVNGGRCGEVGILGPAAEEVEWLFLELILGILEVGEENSEALEGLDGLDGLDGLEGLEGRLAADVVVGLGLICFLCARNCLTHESTC